MSRSKSSQATSQGGFGRRLEGCRGDVEVAGWQGPVGEEGRNGLPLVGARVHRDLDPRSNPGNASLTLNPPARPADLWAREVDLVGLTLRLPAKQSLVRELLEAGDVVLRDR